MDANANFIPKTPPDTRVYAVGDVHGRADLLARLLDAIEADARAPDTPARNVLVLLGDLVDRGPDSRAVLAMAHELCAGRRLPGFEVHVLKGNHEEMMLTFLDQDGYGGSSGARWLTNGGTAALESFAIDVDLPKEAMRAALAAALEPDLRRLLDGLELMHREGDYVFVHAGVRPGVALEAQDAADLMWIRDTFTYSDADFGAFVVHGHTPRAEPVVRANRIGIDTRAWESGVLTCLALQGAERRFLAT